jgi:hypothetical protein
MKFCCCASAMAKTITVSGFPGIVPIQWRSDRS